MKQKPVQTFADAIIASGKAETAATEIGEAVGLKHSTANAIGTDRTALVNANTALNEGITALGLQRAALHAVILMIVAWVTIARDVLKAHLGTKYSAIWDSPGFVGSLTVPRMPERLRMLLEALVAYLNAHTTHQNTELTVTAVRAQELLNDLEAAITGVSKQEMIVKDLRVQRRAKFDAVRTRLSNLFKELSTLLDSLDGRWINFGFNRPGAIQPPATPENVFAVLIGPNAVAVKWPAAARASHYRVWKRVIGLDAELVPVGSPADLDFTLEQLPANSQVEIAVSAVNNGGESDKSEVVIVQTT